MGPLSARASVLIRRALCHQSTLSLPLCPSLCFECTHRKGHAVTQWAASCPQTRKRLSSEQNLPAAWPWTSQPPSVQFSHSVVSDPLQPHGLQRAGLPCPSPTPGVHSNWVSDTIQLSHPLSSPSPPAFNLSQHQGLFQWVSSSHRWPKYWSFSFSISPSNEYSGLISFRMDWLVLFAVQVTLKSLLQHHSSKASILQRSAFFIVQLSHPYMTTGQTIPLTRQTFVSKVMSLLFKMLSKLVIAFPPRSKHLLISWLQSPSAVIWEPKKVKSLTISIVSPSICHEMMGLDAIILVFWMLSFKPAFSLSSFTFVKRLFSSSSLSAIRVVSSAYLRLLIFILAILIGVMKRRILLCGWDTRIWGWWPIFEVLEGVVRKGAGTFWASRKAWLWGLCQATEQVDPKLSKLPRLGGRAWAWPQGSSGKSLHSPRLSSFPFKGGWKHFPGLHYLVIL